jgi:hypothetical protein
MWLHYSQNQFYKIILSLSLCLSLEAFAQTIPLQTPATGLSYPGLFETFELIAKADQTHYESEYNQLTRTLLVKSDLKKLSQVKLTQVQMANLLLYTPESFLKFANKDKCSFYELIITNLAKSSKGQLEYLMIEYKEGAQDKKAMTLKQDFVEEIVLKECPDIKSRIATYQIKNIDSVLKKNKLFYPMEKDQCESVYREWVNNPESPYLCQIQQIIKEGETLENTVVLKNATYQEAQERKQKLSLYRFLKDKISDKIKNDLNHFCEFSHQKDYFCDYFFKVNYWSKIAEQPHSNSILSEMCPALTKKTFNNASKRECLNILKKNDQACHYLDMNKQGLAPAANCEQLAIALNHSSVQRLPQDCPRHSDQLAITNFARILRYQTPTQKDQWKGFCSAISAGTVYNFLDKVDYDDVWNASLCYDDKVRSETVCLPVLIGDYNNSPASLETVVERIMRKTKGLGSTEKCEMVPSDEYNPRLLKFKSGCFIVMNKQNCGIGACDFKIIWDEREVQPFTLEKVLTIDYFASQLPLEQRSIGFLISKVSGKKHQALSSLNTLISFLKKNPLGLVHGVGCSEDLLPQYFRRRSMNECRALPFIIDGMVTEGEQVSLVVRSAVDDIHLPRLIPWTEIYSAVKTYQLYQPLRLWTLYGVF